MMTCVYIFLGGGFGAVSRYGMSSWLNSWLGGSFDGSRFPLGILACNVLGCFLIGLFFAWQKQNDPSWLQPLVVTGFLGGFTTFSTFGLETFKLFESGNLLTTLLYVLATVLGCILALFFAVKIIR